MDSSTVYGYTYDGLNRLTKADASVLNVLDIGGTYAPRLKYGDESMSYDAIGNIATLNRGLYYNPSITTPAYAQQNWVYNYGAGTNNHLIRIDSVNTLPLRKYGYDQNGNGTVHIIETAKNSTDYMRSNLPSHIAITPDTMGVYNRVNDYFDYNNHDDRVYKGIYNDHGSQQYYYLRDASGKELAQYDITNNAWTYYAYGRERIAEYATSGVKYYNYDHLGSTRTVYSVDTDCEDPGYTIENANDYYAFGKTLRSFNGGNKYGHQGSQRENELSENEYYTHYRGLDDEVAKWKQIDPKFKHEESPYVSMGNNPVLYNDVLGDDWGIEKSVDKKTGKETYNISVNGVIINSSDTKFEMSQLNTLKNSMENQIRTAFGIDNDKIKVNISVNLRVITDVNDAKSTDHVFNIVNSKDLGGNLAMGSFQGLLVKVGADGINDIMYNLNTRTIPHELGHTAGLDHPHANGSEKPNANATFPYEYVPKDKMKDNLMSQGWLIQSHGNNLSQSKELTNSQIRLINVNYINGNINYKTQFGESKGYRYIKN